MKQTGWNRIGMRDAFDFERFFWCTFFIPWSTVYLRPGMVDYALMLAPHVSTRSYLDFNVPRDFTFETEPETVPRIPVPCRYTLDGSHCICTVDLTQGTSFNAGLVTHSIILTVVYGPYAERRMAGARGTIT